MLNLLDVTKQGDILTSQRLLSKGASHSEPDSYDNSALLMATENRQTETIECLLNNGDSLTEKNNYGKTISSENQPLEKTSVIKKSGDLLRSKMHTLVNAVNCVGIMGKGIAYHFKYRYPEMFENYKDLCANNKVKIGHPYLYKVNSNRWILNFPTKQHWQNKSKLEYIQEGLEYLIKHAKEWGIKSLAVPPLGCGNGGLEWDKVYPLMEKYLYQLDIPIEIYEPFT